MSTAHAFLPPSGAASWSKCAAWAKMNREFPQDDSAESVEGTAAHWVAWEILGERPISAGSKAPNNQIVTDEMIEGGELVMDTLNERRKLIVGDWNIEQTLPVPFISDECFGTPDVWGFNPSNLHLEIIDYKFGHRFVDEFWNPQGLCYMLAILHFLNKHWSLQDQITVSFTVVQPRCFYKGLPVRTHSFYLREATEHLEMLSRAAAAAMHPDPTATTNAHCGVCPGRHACQTLQLAAYNDAEYSMQRTPLFLSPVAAALELRLLTRALDRIQARVDGLKEQTISNIRAGHQVRYFRVEPGFGRQQWTVSEAQIITIGKLYGQNLSKPGVVTPKQAEKAGVDPQIIKGFSFTPTTGFRLVAENPSDAPRTFARLEGK